MVHSATATDEQAGIYTTSAGLVQLRHLGGELTLFPSPTSRSALFGEMRSPFRGRGMEFEEVRLYQPGDDVRSIDWRVSARTGKPHTKLFREERERPVQLMVDQRSPMFFGSIGRFKSVLAAEIAAALAWAALATGDRVGGLLFGDREQHDIRARRSRHTVLRLLHQLDELNRSLPGDGEEVRSLADMLTECRRICRPGTALFIVSDCHDFDASCERELTLIGRHVDVTLVQVNDPLELQLPMRGELAVGDGRETRTLQFDDELAQRFAAEQSECDERLQRAVRRARGRRFPCYTDRDPADQLRRYFRP